MFPDMMTVFILLSAIILSTKSQTTLSSDCGYLRDSCQYNDTSGNVQNYNGECCTPEVVSTLNSKLQYWRNTSPSLVVAYLFRNNICQLSTTTITTTSASLDCGGLDSDCCNSEAVAYLDSEISRWRSFPLLLETYESQLRFNGLCAETTTMDSTSEATTTPTMTTSTIATTTSLKCGPLTNTTCCTVNVTSCLTDKYGSDWLAYGSTKGYEPQLAACGCVLATTSTSTVSSTTTTPSSNCFWLSTPFTYNTTGYPSTLFSYDGTCCSDIAVDTLTLSTFSWTVFPNATVDNWNKWQALTTILYCTEGACTDPPLWTNCSVSSTSSSTSTSTRSTSTTSVSTSEESTTSEALSSSTVTFVTVTGSDPISSASTSPSTSTEPATSEPTSETAKSSTGTTSFGSSTSSASSMETTTSQSTTFSTTTIESSTNASSSSILTTQMSSTESTSTSSAATNPSSFSSGTSEMTTPTASETPSSTLSTASSTASSTGSSSSTSTSTSTLTSASSSSPEVTTTSSTSSTSESTTGTVTTSETTTTTPTTTVITTPTTTKTITTETTPPKTTTNVDVVYFRNSTVQLFPNCTQRTEELIFFINSTVIRNVTVDLNACSSTTPQTTLEPTTTFNWPTGGTTRMLPTGEILLSESLISYSNCTTVLMQLIYNPSTNTTRTQIESDPDGCKTTSSSTTSMKTSTTPMPSTSSSTLKTTTFNWPTGGTTRVLPSGEIILSESLIAYKNCTTVLMQLIYNPSTNETRTETTTDVEGCKATSTTLSTSKHTTTPMPTTKTSTKSTTSKPATTSSTTPKTTTYNWPTGGTTRVLPSGEIILSESLIAYKNCTTVLMQLIYNPSTNQTRTETTTDAEGCKATSTKATTPMPSPTTSTTPPATTTFNWPTGGTTRTLPSGEIILSESLIAYKNCTTVLMQLIYNPTTNTTRTETTSDAEGCKATTTTTSAPTTTYNWPTGGTTRLLPSGEIILSESLIAYKNCTTVLMQLIYNPSTNTTRTETTSDAQGCKATTTTPVYSTTPMPSESTTTFEWPTGGTTRKLPSGEIILSESLIAYKNCTTVLMQLIYNPSTNKTRTETTSDAEGCKATTSTAFVTTTTPMTTSPTTEPPFTFPESKTTQILPSGEIILSESLTAYPNCTTVLRQLILNPTTNTTRTETTSDAQGCKATTTTEPETATSTPTSASSPSTSCPALSLNMTNTLRPTFNEVKGSYGIGEQVVHLCKKRYAFEIAQQPLKIYQCKSNGEWAGIPEKCVLTQKSEL